MCVKFNRESRFNAWICTNLIPLAVPGVAAITLCMSMEFGWWASDPEEGKYQICVTVHGGNIAWTRKQGHHTSWATYGPPTDADWEKLLAEAARRVPRRLLSPKQFAEIERQRPR